ncbi:tRNA (guanine-N(7)-)-methyltransferase (tRNA(m7G46)-methyltransferase) [Exophiala xenobiotica]|uniref:tRNA (Guanine-N(7)-)-methyltransferase (tRNA(m7G46)-methyltransferase) n=1 Tax=Vermiconidia calcicola TaxID=1690605 RepID=A0AAV9PUI2_9PEZI|nr:tRNA (guanine-N(7)-)-methyltransferase (tRNA(m7G46)-methyltransferase) [Exophiala xenobiotica]KAK5527988.1 tRNA (guanine-N(7)-)-methyltransferase (tRNA(m7G46)-methyltransferase) [Vermiconidia calcicola]KAK5528552.1 tRNA (guanine-N(7)-)-methyltransferase (tRNA(m7G46)-methyltransferase) [Chaetothyriales sp. CCFEE 6169]KAK5291088.1 tRNA (guanine-N(7)-)-methyltransferase (tRNA(m7G46)-methyltransferase) [Exophiala xenobiotica]KAK5333148.1 tRNA (guanine-N(7)-)-methyltransferase (tRNA(m7G46)-methyl
MYLAQKHVLLAAFAAVIAWGLAVRSLPVLRYLGYAFTLGCLVTLSSVIAATLVVSRARPSIPDPHSLPSLTPTFLRAERWRSELSTFEASRQYKPIHIYNKSFVVSQALDALVGLALRDFVSSWYRNITRSPVFVNEVDKNIRAALVELRDRIVNEDMVNVIVSRVVPIITAHLRDFDQAERLVRGRSLNRSVTESEELELAIAAKYKDGKLHPAASLGYSDTKSIQQEYLRKMLVRILPDVLSPAMTGSRATLVLIKEIVACAVLFPIVQLLSNPDTWNQIVEAYGRTALQDRKTVRRMRAALDQHASPVPRMKSDQDLPRLVPNDSERAFERFVRAIRQTRNLSDARRFRNSIASQLQRESIVEGQDPVYLRRLEMAKRVLDQKIGKLSQTTTVSKAMPSQPAPPPSTNAKAHEWTLVEILHTASGLSYFMEYMDRQHQMPLVQFWVVVDGFRNPLEDDFGDEMNPASQQAWTDADRMDIAQISETYMSKPELKTPQESKDAIRSFLVAGRKATPQQYRAARTAILSAQSAVLEELERRHLPDFRKSDLYYKFLASSEASATRPGLQSTSDLDEMNGANSPPLIRAATQAPSMVRTSSQPAFRGKDLRRAAVSSSDVRSLASSKLFDDADVVKRAGSSAPLFDDGYDTDPLAHSTQSLGQESLNGDSAEQRRVIANMEAAMNNIMTDSPLEESTTYDDDALFGSPVSASKSVKTVESPRGSLDMQISDFANRPKPSLATLGLVNTASRIGVFSDNDLFPDEEKFIEDEYVDKIDGNGDEVAEDEIHEAAPGDLGLTEAITALTNDLERLVSQESVVDTLTRKAELTNNVAELRILSKSKASLQREIRRKELQRQQYIVQESDNSLYGRSSISIKSVVVGKEDDGREFALYLIEVHRQAGDQMPAAVWAIPRRYSEFHDLHQRLRRRYPSTRNLEFPRRRVVMKLQKQFLQNRRLALEHYLQQLLQMPDVCRSRELRSFLSQRSIASHNEASSVSNAQDIVSRIYNSVTDGMDEFLGNVSVLDQLSVAGQNLISAATSQLGMSQGDIVPLDPGPVAEAEAELQAFEDKELEPFVKPICDVFLETFELNRGNNWLRGRAVIVVLHQLLGGTIERKIRDLVKGFTTEESLLKYIDMIKETMWPGGGPLRETKARTSTDKKKSRSEASMMLATLVPDLAANVVGRANAQAAARRISATMNNARLNQHLVFTILDELVGVLFDPLKKA